MFVTVINDCHDDNAKARQVTRLQSLFNQPVNFLGVNNDIEASGCLIDILDASEGRDGIVLVNVAPRAVRSWWLKDDFLKRPNGTPFCFFHYKKTLILASIDGETLSLIKKFKIADTVNILDLDKNLDVLTSNNVIDCNLSKEIALTQFRSFDFLPRIAHWIWSGGNVVCDVLDLGDMSEPGHRIWWVDNFGNCKTTMLRSDLIFRGDDMVKTVYGEFCFFERLKDVPDGKIAIVQGSSGVSGKRFLEIVMQGGNCAEQLSAMVGDKVIKNE